MSHIDIAARVSVDSIQNMLKEMDISMKNLEIELENVAKAPKEEDDR